VCPGGRGGGRFEWGRVCASASGGSPFPRTSPGGGAPRPVQHSGGPPHAVQRPGRPPRAIPPAGGPLPAGIRPRGCAAPPLYDFDPTRGESVTRSRLPSRCPRTPLAGGGAGPPPSSGRTRPATWRPCSRSWRRPPGRSAPSGSAASTTPRAVAPPSSSQTHRVSHTRSPGRCRICHLLDPVSDLSCPAFPSLTLAASIRPRDPRLRCPGRCILVSVPVFLGSGVTFKHSGESRVRASECPPPSPPSRRPGPRPT